MYEDSIEAVMQAECYHPAVVALISGSRFLRYREYLYSTWTLCRATDFFVLVRGNSVRTLAWLQWDDWHHMRVYHPAGLLANIPQLSIRAEIWLVPVLRFLEPWSYVLPQDRRTELDFVVDATRAMPHRIWYYDLPTVAVMRTSGRVSWRHERRRRAY
jgi:hypothetical protein